MDEVVRDDHEQEAPGRHPAEREPGERPAAQVERPDRLPPDQVRELRRHPVRRRGRQVHVGDVRPVSRSAQPGHAIVLLEGGAEDRVPRDGGLAGVDQRADVELALQADRQRQVMGDPGGAGALRGPDALLRERGRVPASHRLGSDSLRAPPLVLLRVRALSW
jgi:hypothetical protein